VAKDAPVTVQVDSSSGTIVPQSLWRSGRRYRVTGVVRQWDRGRQRYFDVRLGDGQTAILRFNQCAGQWYLVDVRGKARPT
jgi:hypothetical protein